MPSNYIGFSNISTLKSSGIGPTGPTGPIGLTGNYGISGPTGNTGPYLIGITVVNGTLWNNFSNGISVAASGIARGKTGNVKYILDGKNLGTGVSLIDSVNTDDNKPFITIRPIKFENQIVQTIGSKVVVRPASVATGLSVSGTSNLNKNIVKFLNNSGTLIGITNAFGTAFVEANVIDPAVSYPHTDASHHSGYISTIGSLDTGIGIIINPKPTPNSPRAKAVYLNLLNGANAGLLNWIIINDPSTLGTTNFNNLVILVENAKSNSDKVDTGSPVPKGKLIVALSTVPNRNNQNTIVNAIAALRFIFNNEFKSCLTIDDNINCPILMSIFYNNTFINSTQKYINAADFCTINGYTEDCSSTKLQGSGGGFNKNETVFYSSSINSEELGACCEIDGNCSLKSVYNCGGFFHGSGTTCGSTAQFICNQKGPCCIDNGIIIVCHDEVPCSDCLEFNNIPGVIAKFAGTNLSCNDVDCSLNIFTGACCDGKGNCFELSQSDCFANGGFYHGNFSKCIKDGINTCSGLTGACCIDGVCQQLKYDVCINSGGIFAGYNKTCNNVLCTLEDICSENNTNSLLPGTEYGGGIVVGRFVPGNTKIVGSSELFSKTGYSFTTNKNFNSTLYTSEKEPESVMADVSCNTDDGGYLVIVYPHDISTDYEYNIKNPLTQNYKYNTFHWGLNGYSSWGPIVKFGVYSEIEYEGISYINNVLNYTEGYWYKGVTGSTLSTDQEFITNNFKTCIDVLGFGTNTESRLFNKSNYSLHGNWFRSNGLYNTLRAMYSLKAKSLGITGFMPTTPNVFYLMDKLDSGLTSPVQGITGNPQYLSDWFIPSHDELGFIASKTLIDSAFNINIALLEKGYQPIKGKYWSSTGTFDYSTLQGVYQSAPPLPGALAISMDISETGILENYTTNKTNRQEKNKIRPIRILRCDQQYPSQEKIWKLPKL